VDTPSRDQIVLFEPQAGRPLTDQPVLNDLFSASRTSLTRPSQWLLIVLGGVPLVLPGRPLGIVFPAILLFAGVAGLVSAAVRVIPKSDVVALRESPVEAVPVTDLRQSGRTVAFPLPDARWVVARLPKLDALMLARLRRVWVFGPSPRGRIGLFVPGGTFPRTGRVADAPPPSATPVPAVPAPAEWPPPPKDDPAVQYALTTRLRVGAYAIGMCVLVLALLGADLAAFGPTDLIFGVPAVVFLLPFMLVVVFDIARVRRTRRTRRWAWTRVTLAEPPKATNPYRMRIKVRVDAPGEDILLEVSGPPSLVLAVQESGQLWLIGDLHAARPMVAGIPEVPVIGRVRGTRPPASDLR
jgi:hypothetical protein